MLPETDGLAVCEILGHLGFRTVRCPDGFQALQFLFSTGIYDMNGSAEHLQIAFLSPDLPWPNGQELLTRVRSSDRLAALPIIFVDGLADAQGSSPYPGADAVLTKPVNEGDVVALLTRLGIEAER